MAETTIGTYLGWADVPASSGTEVTEYTKYIDIIDYSDLESAPETIEITTQSDKKRKYKQGLPDQPQQSYTCSYDPIAYGKIKALGNATKAFCILFEESNSLMKWQGQISVQMAGGGVGEARTMTVTVVAETDIDLDGATGETYTKWYYNDTTKKISKTAPAA